MSSRHQYLASDQLWVTEIDGSFAKIAFQMDATTYIAVRVCQHMAGRSIVWRDAIVDSLKMGKK